MQSFEEYNSPIDLKTAIAEMMIIMDMSLFESHYLVNDGMLAEGKIQDLISKAGLHIGKSKGLINHLQAAGKGLFSFFVAALRGDKDEMSKVVKSVKKEDVIDFLLKLDQATLHLITGPLHFIEAVTGWHLWAAIHATQDKAKDIAVKIKNAIVAVKDGVVRVLDTSKSQIHLKHLAKIEKDIGAVA